MPSFGSNGTSLKCGNLGNESNIQKSGQGTTMLAYYCISQWAHGLLIDY